ncbi:MAG: dephospho-CoA kinase [Bdellovibrio sp.]|jgi:dephospho-CoA kinase
MMWIGLTGGLASGKSTVSNLLKRQSIPVIDADELAHQALRPGTGPYQKVLSHFGKSILAGDQSIDRKKLGALVFNQKDELVFLESVIHPYVQEQVLIHREQALARGHGIAVYDVPLLFEKNLMSQFDRILVVGAKEQTQIQRVLKRNQWSREEAIARLRNQLPIEDKIARAHDVIWNEGTLQELELQTMQWLQKMRSMSSSKA